MLEGPVVLVIAYLAASLTFFTGFGLGTILLPVFVPVVGAKLAVPMVAVVHLANSTFKLAITIRQADRFTVMRFGIPAVAAALVGAALLKALPAMEQWSYDFAGYHLSTSPLKAVLGILIATLSIIELISPVFFPKSEERAESAGALEPPQEPTPRAPNSFNQSTNGGDDNRVSNSQTTAAMAMLPLGGILSGFFGGLSGHQGAFRTIFLVRIGLGKEGLIATGASIACLVDLTRITAYGSTMSNELTGAPINLIGAGIIGALAGTFAGNWFLKKMPLLWLERLIAVALVLFGIALAAGSI